MLLWTLERGLGEGFTPEVRSAWAKVYGMGMPSSVGAHALGRASSAARPHHHCRGNESGGVGSGAARQCLVIWPHRFNELTPGGRSKSF